MSIDNLSEIENGSSYDEAIQHLATDHEDVMQGKLVNHENGAAVLNSYDELHTLNTNSLDTELDGANITLPEAQDVNLHANVGTEHLDGLSGSEDGSIAANLHIIDLSGG